MSEGEINPLLCTCYSIFSVNIDPNAFMGRAAQEGEGLNATTLSLLGIVLFSFSPTSIGQIPLNQLLISLHLQLGTFRFHDGDYFIEPLLSVDEQEDEEEQNKPHIIYRRKNAQKEPSAGSHACDTSGICFLV